MDLRAKEVYVLGGGVSRRRRGGGVTAGAGRRPDNNVATVQRWRWLSSSTWEQCPAGSSRVKNVCLTIILVFV